MKNLDKQRKFSDFVFYNYSIDEALAVANKTFDPEMEKLRLDVRIDLRKKFMPLERMSNEETCEPTVPDYAYDYS